METTRPRHILPLVAVLIFVVSLAGYVGLRTGMSSDLFGGDAVNVSTHHPASFVVDRSNVDLPAMAKAILSGRDGRSPNNPHAFVYGQLSSSGRLALERFVSRRRDTRSETEFLLDFDRSVIDREVSWPAAFRGPPLVGGRSVNNLDVRGKNLLALAAVYPIRLPVNTVANAFKELGWWGGMKALKPFAVSAFTLSQPTRYTPLTNIYVIAMQSFLAGHPDQVITAVVVTGILYAMLALIVFLLAEAVLGSIPWAVASAFFTMAAASTIGASVTLFSLPYLFVPIVMGMAFYAYLQFKQGGAPAWLLLFSLCALLGPWFREFAAAIPLIVLACEAVLPTTRRSWVVLILCLFLAGHSVYPSFLTWLIGINHGIVAGVFQQANTHAQMRSSSPANLGLLFVQFPPSYWILSTFGMSWWLWHRVGPASNTRIQLPFRDVRLSVPLLASRSWWPRAVLLALLLAATQGLVTALFVLGDSQPFPMIEWNWPWAFALVFIVLIGLFSLRFGTLLPTYFAATSIPFLWLSLAEVHMAFTIPPLAIMLTAWVRELFQGLATAGATKIKGIAIVLLAVSGGDQFLNYPAFSIVQERLTETNRTIADWIVGHTQRNSVVISNFYNYTDIYYYSGNYFDPYESVENNPLGSARTIHDNEQMSELLDNSMPLRDIYFLQGDHEFFEWQRYYHSHKWVVNPPGKIVKLKEFPAKVYYYYLDPIKYFVPRNFVSFLGYMDWSSDYYFNNDTSPFRRVVDVTYRIFRLEDRDPLALQKAAPIPSFSSVPILLKESVGATEKFNLVHFQDRVYAIPQALGQVDWNSGKVDAMKGVIVATNFEEVMAKVSAAKPAFTPVPILLNESVGPNESYNLIHFQDRFYAVPQALGAIDWKSGKVATAKGVIVAASPEKVMARLNEAKPISPASADLDARGMLKSNSSGHYQRKHSGIAIP